MFDKVIIFTHIFAGITTLLSGILAIVANPKGNKLHRISGQIFFWCMVVIFVTSIIMTIFIKFNFFLLGIAILSFFMSFTGYRALKRKKPNEVELVDHLVAYIGLASGVAMITYGIVTFLQNTDNYSSLILSGVFGMLLASNAYKDIKHFKKTEYSKMWWWFHHMNFMMTSFIAAVTAFLVNNIYKVVDLGSLNFIFWLLPTIVLVPLIIRWKKHYKKKFKLTK